MQRRVLGLVLVSAVGAAPGCAAPELPREGARGELLRVEGSERACDVAMNAGRVFWTQSGDGAREGAVMSMDLEDVETATARLVADGEHHPCAVVADARMVAWVTYGANGTGNVLWTDVEGGARRGVADSVELAGELAAGDGALFWTDVSRGTVHRGEPTSGSSDVVASTSDGTRSIAWGAEGPVWADGTVLLQASEDGPIVLWRGIDPIATIAADGDLVAWTTESGELFAMQGEAEPSLVAEDAVAVAVGGGRLFFSTEVAVYALSRAGEVDVVASDVEGASRLATDGEHLAWIGGGQEQVVVTSVPGNSDGG